MTTVVTTFSRLRSFLIYYIFLWLLGMDTTQQPVQAFRVTTVPQVSLYHPRTFVRRHSQERQRNLLLQAAAVGTEDTHEKKQTNPPSLIRIYTGEDEQSHIETVPLDMKPFTDKEGAYGFATSYEDCPLGISFRVSAPGYELDWHCAPRKQYVIQLQGYLEVICGDGTNVIAGPGDVLLAEDRTGQGHKTRVVGDQDRVYVVVPLEE